MTLVIMAAGMGSRYGGLKQIDPVGPNGEFLVDFSVYDAKRAGFDKVVFVINEAHRKDFDDTVGSRIKGIKVEYAYQKLNDIPEGFSVPENRVKPWGTGQAVLCAKKYVTDPFIVINADDFYSKDAFDKLFTFLKKGKKDAYCMAGFRLCNTITENGTVSRGVCSTDNSGTLLSITERTKIKRNNGIIQYFENDTWTDLEENTPVSMNCWGFTPDFFDILEREFKKFLSADHPDPLKSEFYLPSVVKTAMDEDNKKVSVLPTCAKWYGVTYKEDRDGVVSFLKRASVTGIYPENLWRG